MINMIVYSGKKPKEFGTMIVYHPFLLTSSLLNLVYHWKPSSNMKSSKDNFLYINISACLFLIWFLVWLLLHLTLQPKSDEVKVPTWESSHGLNSARYPQSHRLNATEPTFMFLYKPTVLCQSIFYVFHVRASVGMDVLRELRQSVNRDGVRRLKKRIMYSKLNVPYTLKGVRFTKLLLSHYEP